LLEMLQVSIGEGGVERAADFSLEVCVEMECDTKPGEPRFRGSQHIVVVTFGPHTVLLFDLLRHRIVARVSRAVAGDEGFWALIMQPLIVGLMASSIGTLPVHCACLVDRGNGLLIAGNGGAGKSTLSATLSIAGMEYLADEWTYIRREPDGLHAFGVGARIKLLPDAERHFPQLAERPLESCLNGESSHQVDAGREFGARVARSCRPRWFLFVHRRDDTGCEFRPEEPAVIRRYLDGNVERLPAELKPLERRRSALMDHVSQLPCWRFSYGGTPQYAAIVLKHFMRRQCIEDCA